MSSDRSSRNAVSDYMKEVLCLGAISYSLSTNYAVGQIWVKEMMKKIRLRTKNMMEKREMRRMFRRINMLDVRSYPRPIFIGKMRQSNKDNFGSQKVTD